MVTGSVLVGQDIAASEALSASCYTQRRPGVHAYSQLLLSGWSRMMKAYNNSTTMA